MFETSSTPASLLKGCILFAATRPLRDEDGVVQIQGLFALVLVVVVRSVSFQSLRTWYRR